MSGGVDSAVAAARAAEAGHDVTGIHLALSRNPKSYRTGARGCCTIEDANDARRAADVIGIPFYVWDLSDRFHEDVVETWPSTPPAARPTRACAATRRSSSPRRPRARPRPRLRRGRDRPLRAAGDRDGRPVELHRAEDMGKDQSYVLGVLAQEQLRHSLFPLGGTPKAQVRAEAERRGLSVAQKPDSHDICFISDGDTGGWLADKLGAGTGEIVDHALRRGARQSRRRLRLHHRTAQGPADRPPRRGRQAALRAGHRAGQRHRHGGTARRAHRRPDQRHPAALVQHPIQGELVGTVQLRAHGDEHQAVVRVEADPAPGAAEVTIELLDSAQGIAPGQAAVVYDGSRVVGSCTISAPHGPPRSPGVAPDNGRLRGRVDARHVIRRGPAPRPRRAPRPPAPARGPRPRGAGDDDRPRTRRAGRTRRQPAARGLAAHRQRQVAGVDHRRARSLLAQDLDALEGAHAGLRGAAQDPGGGPVDAGRDRREARGDRVLSDRGAAAGWRRRWPRGCAPTSPTSAAGCRGRRCSCRSTSPPSQSCSRARCPPPQDCTGTARSTAAGLRAAGGGVRGGRRGGECRSRTAARPTSPSGFWSVPAQGVSVDLAVLAASAYDDVATLLRRGAPCCSAWCRRPTRRPCPPTKQLTEQVLRFLGMLGFDPAAVGGSLVVTPSCGLAGATTTYARAAVRRARRWRPVLTRQCTSTGSSTSSV